MSFPPSVERIVLPRPKAGNPRPRTKLLREEEELPDPHEPGSNVGVGGPTLDFGRDGGVTLERERGRWAWRWAMGTHNDLRLAPSGEHQLLFPPTRSTESPKPPLPMNVLLASATQQLRGICDEYSHMGIDELILPELEAEHRASRRPPYDPFPGKTLELINFPKSRLTRVAICFATGPIGSQLNISPFLPRTNASVEGRGVSKYNPTAKAVDRFSTEILQICSSPATTLHRNDRDGLNLLVRLHSYTHLLLVTPNPTYMPPTDVQPFATTRIATVTPSDTEGRRHVDVALDPKVWGRAVIVDEGGGLWMWSEERIIVRDRTEKKMRLTKIREPILGAKDGFFRVAFGTRDGALIFVTSKEAVTIDLEDKAYPTTPLLSLTGQTRMFTAIEKTASQRKAPCITLCTTHEIIWIDELRPGVPALSWRHDYGGGRQRDLLVSVIEAERGECVLLSSRSNRLVMAFHLSSSLPLRFLLPPYLIQTPNDMSIPTDFTAVSISRNSVSRRAPTILLGQTPDGAIHGLPLLLVLTELEADRLARMNRGKGPSLRSLKVRWGSDMEELAKAAPEMDKSEDSDDEDAENPAHTRYSVLSCRWAWIAVNGDSRSEAEEGQATSSVEDFMRALREMDAPLDYFMTPAEILRDVLLHESESGEIHSRGLSPMPLDTSNEVVQQLGSIDFSRLFALVNENTRDRIAPDSDSESRNNSSVSPLTLLEDLQDRFPFPPKSLRTAFRTKSQADLIRLAIDLALSSTVFSSEDAPLLPAQTTQISRPSTPDELFARTAGLSLNDQEAPPMSFNILPPRIDHTPSEDESPLVTESKVEATKALDEQPARTLLSEWTLGSDPANYVWKPWRDHPRPDFFSPATRPIRPLPSPRPSSLHRFPNSQPTVPTFKPHRPLSAQYPPTLTPISSFSPFPPPIVSLRPTESVPDLRKSIRDGIRSSPPIQPYSSPPPSGGEFPSTQVERGVFGGRPEAGARTKKKAKKRAGGF